MAKKSSFRKEIEQYLTPQYIAIASVGLLILFFILISFVRRFTANSDAPISEDQIMLQRNGETIIINRNGLVEYKKEDTVTYKLWSSDKVSNFFASMEEKARAYLSSSSRNTVGCIFVTLYLDGELVTVCIDEDDELIQSTFLEFESPEGDDSISIGDLFGGGDDNDNNNNDNVDDISDYFNQPTATPTIVLSTPIPQQDYDEDNPPIKADCLNWEENIVGERAIISNTLCSIQRVIEE